MKVGLVAGIAHGDSTFQNNPLDPELQKVIEKATASMPPWNECTLHLPPPKMSPINP
jgi:hypothetical protein